jgi:hypothetical protein
MLVPLSVCNIMWLNPMLIEFNIHLFLHRFPLSTSSKDKTPIKLRRGHVLVMPLEMHCKVNSIPSYLYKMGEKKLTDMIFYSIYFPRFMYLSLLKLVLIRIGWLLCWWARAERWFHMFDYRIYSGWNQPEACKIKFLGFRLLLWRPSIRWMRERDFL